MSYYEVDDKGNLRDPQGKVLGHIDYDNRVRDSYHDRGYITDQGRYVDEYDRDIDWVIQSNRSFNDNWDNGEILINLAKAAGYLVAWLEARKNRSQNLEKDSPSSYHHKRINAVEVKQPLEDKNLKLPLRAEMVLEFNFIPEGAFTMGYSGDDYWFSQYSQSAPAQEIFLQKYWMGKYPVTVEQFDFFLHRSGYRCDWSFPGNDLMKHPVTNIRWIDALEFCNWVSQVTGHIICLPTEPEWEKAARGTDGRIFPWGSELKDKNWANWKGSGTTAIGRFSPQGDSPYGCSDMAGNVAEWVSSLYMKYPYNPNDGRENPDPSIVNGYNGKARCVRGGSFNESIIAISTFRREGFGDIAHEYIGFRCACLK